MALPKVRRSNQALVASASRPGASDSQYAKRQTMSWQRRALQYIDLVPELNFASRFYSRMLKPVRLFPATLDDNGGLTPITSGPPVDLLNRIQDPGGGRSLIQSSYGRLMFTAGEGSLFGRHLGAATERWAFVWNDELEVETDFRGNIKAIHHKIPGGQDKVYPPDQAVVYRMWTPHPRNSFEADSPMRSILDVAEELITLTHAVMGTAVSRLTNGILFMPSEVAPPPPDAGGDEDPLNDPFYSDVAEYFSAQVENPGSAEARVPIIEWVNGDMIEKIRHLKLHDAANDYMERDLRKEAIDRMALGLDMPPETLKGMGSSNHWCQASDTEIMTRDRGFIQNSELSVGDIVQTLNVETGLSEWQPVLDIYRADVEDEAMLALRNRDHDSLSTLHHRWPTLRMRQDTLSWRTSETLDSQDRILRGAVSADLPVEPIYEDAFVELVAWFVTEGTCTWPSDRHCQVRIGQSHKVNLPLVRQIRETLTRLFGPAHASLLRTDSAGAAVAPAFREGKEDRGMTLFHLNKTAYAPLLDTMESWRSKVVSREFILNLTRGQLDLFLKTLALGDGCVRGDGLTVGQRDPRRLEPVELAAVLAGRPLTWSTRMSGGFGEPKELHVLSVHDPRRPATQVYGMRQERKPYSGTVWCPTTKNGTWLARRNGTLFYTGNSALQVMADQWKSHGLGVAMQFASDLGEVYLRPGLAEEGYDDWKRVVIGVDGSQVTMKPDRTDDADKAIQVGAIGWDAYRELKSLGRSMAPSDKERSEIRDFIKGGRVTNAPSDANPSNGPPPPGPEGDSGRKTRIVASAGIAASARELGAIEMSLMRCRELAGARLRNKEKMCPECLAKAENQPLPLVAAAVGEETVKNLDMNAFSLVQGGTDTLRFFLDDWGWDKTQVSELCSFVEVYAASTLFDPETPSLPIGFMAQIEQMKEKTVLGESVRT